MTEQEWLACNNPRPMLSFLHGRTSDRKLRLFACACCRRVWHLLTDQRSRLAVEVAEKFADGLVHTEQLLDADQAAHDAAIEAWFAADDLAGMAASSDAEKVAHDTAEAAFAAEHTVFEHAIGAAFVVTRTVAFDACTGDLSFDPVINRGQSAQVAILLDLFGNPFNSVPIDPAWHGGTIPLLAQAAYEDRLLPSGHLDGHRLAVLADALTDAGCDDQEILGHLRGPGPHVRGCWVVDLLLGKE